jgi:hypothetical protein
MAGSFPIVLVVAQNPLRPSLMAKKKIRKLVRKKLGVSTKLYKTTIVIWSEYNGESVEIDELARDAMRGGSFCTLQSSKLIEHPNREVDWDSDMEEFFNLEVRPKRCPLPRSKK